MDQWVASGGRRLDEQTGGWKEGRRGGGRLDVQVEGGRGTLLVTVTRPHPPTMPVHVFGVQLPSEDEDGSRGQEREEEM